MIVSTSNNETLLKIKYKNSIRLLFNFVYADQNFVQL